MRKKKSESLFMDGRPFLGIALKQFVAVSENGLGTMEELENGQ